jgi:hypothetical protein
MKLTLTFLLAFGWQLASIGQQVQNATELIIIGTKHTGNKKFNHKTIYSLLAQYKPDVVLQEYDTDFKKVFGVRTAAFLKLARPSIEQLALQKFANKNKKIPVLGFDTSFNRKPYIKNLIKEEPRFFDYLDTTKMTVTDSMLYWQYAKAKTSYFELINNADIFTFNSDSVVNLNRILSKWDKDSTVYLGRRYVKDTALSKNFESNVSFWESRNNFMVKKIRQFCDTYKGKRIIVLTGLNHKYFLVDGAKKWADVSLKEISAN